MSRSSREPGEAADIEPLDVDGVRTVALLTVLWGVAFVALAVRRAALEATGSGWWLWTCLAGVGLGLLGLEYTRKRRDAIERANLLAEGVDDDFDDIDDDANDVAQGEATEGGDAGAAEPLPVRQAGDASEFTGPGTREAAARPVQAEPERPVQRPTNQPGRPPARRPEASPRPPAKDPPQVAPQRSAPAARPTERPPVDRAAPDGPSAGQFPSVESPSSAQPTPAPQRPVTRPAPEPPQQAESPAPHVEPADPADPYPRLPRVHGDAPAQHREPRDVPRAGEPEHNDPSDADDDGPLIDVSTRGDEQHRRSELALTDLDPEYDDAVDDSLYRGRRRRSDSA